MSVESKNNWLIIFILIPLLPFFIGGVLNSLVVCLSCLSEEEKSVYAICIKLLRSLDALKFSFAVSIMAFFVKKDLNDLELILPNEDKRNEIRDTTGAFLIYGILELVLFGGLVLINSIVKDCNESKYEFLYHVLGLLSYVFGIIIIRKSLIVQETFKLKSKSFI